MLQPQMQYNKNENDKFCRKPRLNHTFAVSSSENFRFLETYCQHHCKSVCSVFATSVMSNIYFRCSAHCCAAYFPKFCCWWKGRSLWWQVATGLIVVCSFVGQITWRPWR